MRNKIKAIFILILGLNLLYGCSGGSGNSNSSITPNPLTPGNLSQLSISAPYILPNKSSAITYGYVYLKNNSDNKLNNLSYSIQNNTAGIPITMDQGQCQSIATGASCTLTFSIARTNNAGNFNIQVTNYSTNSNNITPTSTTKSLTTTTNSLNSNLISLSNIPATTNNGAKSITLLAPAYVLSNQTGQTQVMVNALVNSPLNESFNTIKLTAAGGTPLNYIVLSHNNGLADLQQGNMVTFVVTIPSSAIMLPVYVQIGNTVNGTYSSLNITDKAAITITPISSGGILSMSPANVHLTTNYDTQLFTISNMGNQTINGLNITLTQAQGVSGINNCGTSLAPNQNCTYKVTLNASQAGKASTTLYATFSGRSTADKSSATINYKGTARHGLTLSSNITNFNTMVGQSESSILTVKNTGSVQESNISFKLPNSDFSLSNSGLTDSCILVNNVINNLRADQACTLAVNYLSNQVTSPTFGDISANYFLNESNYDSSISISYMTTNSYPAIIQVSPPNYTFPNIFANGESSLNTTFTVSNIGGTTADNIGTQIINNSANSFQQINNSCGVTLNPEESCTVTIQAGPATESGTQTANLNVSYGNNQNESVPLQAKFLAYHPKAPQIELSVTTAGTSSGNGYESSPFTYMYNSNGNITLTYTNMGTLAATSFNVTVPPISGYTSIANNCQNVPLAIYGQCKIVLTPNTTISQNGGSYNIPLNNLQYTVNNGAPQSSTWKGQNTLYVSFLSQIPVGLNSFSLNFNESSYLGTFESNNTIIVNLPLQTSNFLSTQESLNLVATYTLVSSGDTVTVNGILQTNKTTSNNFWNQVVYTVSAPGSTPVTYTVYVLGWNSFSALPPWSTYDGFHLTALAADPYGDIFVGGEADDDSYMTIYNITTKSWSTIAKVSGDELGTSCIAPVDSNTAYAGTTAYSIGGNMTYVDVGATKNIEGFHIGGKYPTAAYYASNGYVYYGNSHSGLSVYKPSSGDTTDYEPSLSNYYVSSIGYDGSNILYGGNGFLMKCDTDLSSSSSCTEIDSGASNDIPYIAIAESISYVVWGATGNIYEYSAPDYTPTPVYFPQGISQTGAQMFFSNIDQALVAVYINVDSNTSIQSSGQVATYEIAATGSNQVLTLPNAPEDMQYIEEPGLQTFKNAQFATFDPTHNNLIELGADGQIYWLHIPSH